MTDTTPPAYQPGDRVRTTVDAPPHPTGSLGTIAHAGYGLGVVLDDDPTQLPAAYTADEIEHARPTPADSRAAMDALIETIGLDGIETVIDPAVGYIQDRLAHYGENPLWGRDTAMVTAAMALAIRAYAERTATLDNTDAWDVSRMEHETDILRDRITALETEADRLRAHLSDAENYLRLTHAYPSTGGGHDTLGAGFSCDGCQLAKRIKAAVTPMTEEVHTDD